MLPLRVLYAVCTITIRSSLAVVAATGPFERTVADAQIVSGLRLFVPLEKMQGRMVVVLTNLKPAKM